MEIKRVYDLFKMRISSVDLISQKPLLACVIMFFVVFGFGAAKSESEVTYANSDMPLFYYRTAENIQERFELKKAWYARINELILELSPESDKAFIVSKPKDGDYIPVKRNYSGDVDLIMLIAELEDRELFRLTCEASRKETWKDLNIERGISRLRKDVLRQTRILEKEKFEPLTIVCESTFNSYRYILLSGTMPQKNASRYNDLEEGVVPEKVRFDCILRIGGKATCLAQRGNFWFDRKWIYSSDSENSDKIYVRRYFHVYGKRLSEFVEDLKKIRFPKDYEFLLGAREKLYPETIHLAALVYSDDGKSLVPVLVYGEADAQSKDPTKVKFWSLSIGTPISIPKEFAQ